MNKFEGNTMYISNFTDFYYLEALSAQITMAISASPEMAFRHSVEKLEADVKEAFAELTKQMAFRIYVYLWAAALGEARYAKGFDLPQYIEELSKGASRQHAYGQALEHFPSDKNVAIVKSVFNQHWGGSYGGRAWLSIVEGMELYGKVSDATFIDHAVDLEHNGGCVFNKSARFGLDCMEGMWNTSQLKHFLDFKFSHNILEDKYSYFDSGIPVTRKVYNLIKRYWNIVCKVGSAQYIKTLLVLENLSPTNNWLTGYAVDWGHNEFTIGGKNKTIRTQKTVKISGSHVHLVRDGHSYLVKYDGYGHGVGFVGKMHRYDGHVIRVARHDKDGYAHSFVWARQWLYRTTTETKEQPSTIIVNVKRNANEIDGGSLGFVEQMNEYLGKTVRLHLAPETSWAKGKYWIKSDTGHTWFFVPQWYDIVEERRERHEACNDCGNRAHSLYNGLCLACYVEKYQTCYHCGDECRSEDTAFSDITYRSYCETCYNEIFTVCDKCGNEMMREDSIDCLHHPTAYHMHKSCAREEMHKCWECDEWFPKDEMVSPEDDYDFYCPDCVEKKGMKCETCGKIYYDIDAHIKDHEEE